MNDDDLKKMTYEQKESRLDEILTRLDKSETPMDELASDAREAAKLIMLMQGTLKATRQEITDVFTEMEKQKELLGSARQEPLVTEAKG